MLAHELRAEQHAGLRVGDDLHKAAAGPGDHGTRIGKERALADLDRDIARLGIGLGQADGGDLRAAIDAAGDEVQPDARRAARKPLHASRSLRRRDVGQLHRRRNIADGIDAGDARLPVLIRVDAAAVRLRLEAVCEQALPVRAAAEGREHGLARDEVLLAAGGKVDGQTVLALLDALDHGVGKHAHALLLEQLCKVLTELAVHAGQQAVKALDHGNLAAEVAVERGKFHADDAAAHDDDGAVEAVRSLKQLIRGHGKLKAGNGRAGRNGAGGDEDMIRRDGPGILPGDLDAAGSCDAGAAAQ